MFRRLKGVHGGLLCGGQFGSNVAQIDLTAEVFFSVGEVELKLCSPDREVLSGRFPGKGHEGIRWVGPGSHFSSIEFEYHKASPLKDLDLFDQILLLALCVTRLDAANFLCYYYLNKNEQ